MCPNATRILAYYEFNFPRAMPTPVEEVSHVVMVLQNAIGSLL
jgi:hypothetical protein